jgi:hypothetical protein
VSISGTVALAGGPSPEVATVTLGMESFAGIVFLEEEAIGRGGSFTFGTLSPGTYHVRATADGFRPHEEVVTIPRPEASRQMRLELHSRPVVRGRMLDSSGAPAVGRKVELRRANQVFTHRIVRQSRGTLGERNTAPPGAFDTTDGEGAFTIPWSESGSYLLEVALGEPSDGIWHVRELVLAGEDDVDLEVTLPATTPLVARLTGLDDPNALRACIEDDLFWVVSLDEGVRVRHRPAISRDGVCSTARLPVGRYHLVTGTVATEIVHPSPDEIEVSLPGGAIRGVVSGGSPRQRCVVQATPIDGSYGTRTGTHVTCAPGEPFTLRLLPPGEFLLEAWTLDRSLEAHQLRLDGSSVSLAAPVTLNLRPSCQLIVHPGKPGERAVLARWRTRDTVELLAQWVPRWDVQPIRAELDPETCTVLVAYESSGVLVTEPVILQPGSIGVFQLDRQWSRGRLCVEVHQPDGSPAPGVRVEIFDLDGRVIPTARALLEGLDHPPLTDEDGSFDSGVIPTGTYEVVIGEGEDALRRHVEIDDVLALLEVTLER